MEELTEELILQLGFEERDYETEEFACSYYLKVTPKGDWFCLDMGFQPIVGYAPAIDYDIKYLHELKEYYKKETGFDLEK